MKSQEMYIIVFGVFILKFQISLSDPQFPRHIDLQKVGEAIFNNEKFNILKPTAHLITDHFKDFMLRQGSDNPAERVFIDKNGFRHAWSGFGDKTKSLRKTDQKQVIFENIPEETPESDIIPTNDNDNDDTTAKVGDNNENENNNQGEDNNKETVTDNDTETAESKKTTTIINIFRVASKMKSTKITQSSTDDKKEHIKNKNMRARKNKIATAKANKDNKASAKERTVATTTFFCPFLGVITMSSFID